MKRSHHLWRNSKVLREIVLYVSILLYFLFELQSLLNWFKNRFGIHNVIDIDEDDHDNDAY